jgi:hypothetical protein
MTTYVPYRSTSDFEIARVLGGQCVIWTSCAVPYAALKQALCIQALCIPCLVLPFFSPVELELLSSSLPVFIAMQSQSSSLKFRGKHAVSF